MPRVLQVIPTLDGHGAEKQFALLCAGLKAAGDWDVHAVALTRGGPHAATLAAAGVPTTVLHKRLKLDPVALVRLRTLIRRLKPDLIHAWTFTANANVRLVAGGGVGSRKSGGPPVVVGMRCVDDWQAGWQQALDRRQLPRTAAVVCNGEAVREHYAARGVPETLLHVIPNGVEIPPRSRGVATPRLSTREELFLPPDARAVTFAGRLAAQKRPGDLVWGFHLLSQLQPLAHHVVLGDGPLRGRLEREADHYGSGPRQHFAGRRDDAADLIAASDVFWLASAFEGQSNALMEAMAAGVPPIVSDIPPNRELVTDGETGFLVPVGDAVGYAQWADRLLADEELSRRIGEAARTRMENSYPVAGMVAGYGRLYHSLMNS